MRTVLLAAIGLMLVAPAALAQEELPSCPSAYQNHNQIEYGPLLVRAVAGRVIDRQSAVVPGACLTVFSEIGHKLVTSARTDAKGGFRLAKIREGRYRVVVMVDGFCAASVPIRLSSRAVGEKQLLVQMRAPGVDDCSFGTLEDRREAGKL